MYIWPSTCVPRLEGRERGCPCAAMSLNDMLLQCVCMHV